jgi:hypothetical protein
VRPSPDIFHASPRRGSKFRNVGFAKNGLPKWFTGLVKLNNVEIFPFASFGTVATS